MTLHAATTYAPGDTVVLMERYGSIWNEGDIGHVIEAEPATDNASELVHFVRASDGEVCEGVFAFRLAPGVFEKGDRVAIESNVYAASGEHYDVLTASVGDTGTVASEADADGDVYVRLDGSERIVPIAASGLVYLGETEPTDEEVAEQEATASVEDVLRGIYLDAQVGVAHETGRMRDALEMAAEREAQDQYALPFAIPQTFIAGVEAPSIADMLEAILSPAAEAEEADEEDDADEFYDADLSRRADALALAYDVLIDAATKAHEAGAATHVDLGMAISAAYFILGDEEGDE